MALAPRATARGTAGKMSPLHTVQQEVGEQVNTLLDENVAAIAVLANLPSGVAMECDNNLPNVAAAEKSV
jgi:hypothetical protein